MIDNRKSFSGDSDEEGNRREAKQDSIPLVGVADTPDYSPSYSEKETAKEYLKSKIIRDHRSISGGDSVLFFADARNALELQEKQTGKKTLEDLIDGKIEFESLVKIKEEAFIAGKQTQINELIKLDGDEDKVAKEILEKLEKHEKQAKVNAARKIFEELEKNENMIIDSQGSRPMNPALLSINRKAYEKIKLGFGVEKK